MKKLLLLARQHAEKWLPAVIVVAALLAWELGVKTGKVPPLFFPAPSTIFLTLVQLVVGGELAANMGATLSRVIVGLAIGGMTGLFLGLILGRSRRLRIVIDPFIAAIHPLPKIALLPLIMILFGIGETSKVVLVTLGTLFPMLINTVVGVRQINPIYFDVAANYGASPRKVFSRVVVPGSLPLVLAGVRLALNVALLLTIAVELSSAQRGLGAMIWLAWETLRTEELYATLGVIAMLGIIFNLLLQWLTARLAPWLVEQET